MRVPDRRGLTLLAGLLLVVACERSLPPPAATATPQAPAPVEAPLPEPTEAPAPVAAPADEGGDAYDRHAGIRYVEVITGGAEAEATLPMIVAIHGLGDRPESFAGLVRGLRAPARVILPAGLDPSGDGFSWFPIRARSKDVEGLSTGLAAAADRLAIFVGEIARDRPTAGKPIVTGFSQGGMLSFAIAVRHPELIAAALPIGGWLPPPLWPEAPAPAGAPPIVALHGAADTVVAPGPTREAVARLVELGYAVELREYPEVAHQISAEMRRALSERLAAEASAAAAGAGE